MTEPGGKNSWSLIAKVDICTNIQGANEGQDGEQTDYIENIKTHRRSRDFYSPLSVALFPESQV